MMKKRKIFSVFVMLLCIICCKAQVAGLTINLETDLINYTVTAQADTIFSRKAAIIVPDTMALQHVNAVLSEFQSGNWQVQLNGSFNPPSASDSIPCSTGLCLYRENENRWILYLGNYSLSRRYKIALYFNNHTNPDWTLEY